jgi:transaldolase
MESHDAVCYLCQQTDEFKRAEKQDEIQGSDPKPQTSLPSEQFASHHNKTNQFNEQFASHHNETNLFQDQLKEAINKFKVRQAQFSDIQIRIIYFLPCFPGG